MIYLIIFIGLIALHQAFVIQTNRGKIDWFSDLTMVDATFFILFVVGMYLVNPQIGERMNTRFAIMIISGMLATYIGLHAKVPSSFKRFSQIESPPNVRILLVLSIIYLLLVFLQLLSDLRSSEVGLYEYLITGHLSTALSNDYLGGSQWIIYLSQAFRMPILILIMYSFLNKKRGLAFTLMIILAFIAFIRQDRLDFFMLLMFFIFYYHRIVRPVKAYQLALLFMLALLISGAFDNLRSTGTERVIQNLTSVDYIIQRSKNDLNPTKSLERISYMDSDGKLEYDYFYQYLLSLAGQIPRVVWTNKPITAFEPRYTEIVYAVKVGTGVPIKTFTVVGEGIAMLGLVGVIINGFVFGYIYRITRAMVGSNRYTVLVWYSFCLLFFPFFRGSTSALLAYWVRTFLPLLILWPYIFPRADAIINPKRAQLKIVSISKN